MLQLKRGLFCVGSVSSCSPARLFLLEKESVKPHGLSCSVPVWESPLEREEHWSCWQSEEPGWGGCASLVVCFECRFLVVQREKEGAQPLEVARGSLLRGVNAAESWADVCVQVPLPHKDKSRVS